MQCRCAQLVQSVSSSRVCAIARGSRRRRLHPTIGVHSPLTFDLIDTWMNRLARWLPISRGASRRPQLFGVPGERLRGGEPATGGFLPPGAHPGPRRGAARIDGA